MFPSALAAPDMYPRLLRPPAAHSLPQSLHSAFAAHSSFLVEDLLRISRPVSYLHRTIPLPSVSPPGSGATTLTCSHHTDQAVITTSAQTRTGSPQNSLSINNDPNYLKFGVTAILAPETRNGEIIGNVQANINFIIQHLQTGHLLRRDLNLCNAWIEIMRVVSQYFRPI